MVNIIDCTNPAAARLTAIKARQQATWASGDYAVIGTPLQLVAEQLCETVDVQPGARVLDVATGHGNTAIAAARRLGEVTGVDYVPALLERARERAAAERLAVHFTEGDAETLPFPDASFDVVLSSFGVMFTANQERAAGELLRVCRPGGRIGLANWTPEGFIGQVFRTIGRHVPPPPELKSPALWGTDARLRELFADGAEDIRLVPREHVFRYRSARHWIDVFRAFYGPVQKAFEALDAERGDALDRDLTQLLDGANRSPNGSLAVPSTYVDVVIKRR